MKSALFEFPKKGEFGWELMHWQGFVRKEAKKYDRVYVSCPESSKPLYNDIDIVFVVYGKEFYGTIDMHYKWQKDKIIPFDQQEFIKYGMQCESPVDIIIHARNTRFQEKNWPVEKWNKLVRLMLDSGFSVASIGNAAHHIEGTYDLTTESLDAVFDYLYSAKCIVGPSSGPMHLASLCGCSQVVWGDERLYVGGNTLRQRYQETWNPLNTFVYYLETNWEEQRWDIDVDTVWNFTKNIIKQEGRREMYVNETQKEVLSPIQKIQQSVAAEREMHNFLIEARKHGKFFININYKTDDMRNEFKHFNLIENMNSYDVKHCLDHVSSKVNEKHNRKLGGWK